MVSGMLNEHAALHEQLAHVVLALAIAAIAPEAIPWRLLDDVSIARCQQALGELSALLELAGHVSGLHRAIDTSTHHDGARVHIGQPGELWDAGVEIDRVHNFYAEKAEGVNPLPVLITQCVRAGHQPWTDATG